MTKKVILAIVVVVAALGALAGIKVLQFKS
jgi:hypothetical protein